MTTRILLHAALTVALVTAPLAANSQQTPKVHRVGVLAMGGSFSSQMYQGFREQLRMLGYVEGRTLVFEFRSAEGRPEKYLRLQRRSSGRIPT